MTARPPLYGPAALRCLVAGLAALLGGLAAPSPALAQPARYADLPPAEAYSRCLERARSQPEEGFEAAIAWRDEGGGPPARHCVALALFGLGQYGEAADRLEALAAEMPEATGPQRATVLGQAGNVWLRAGELGRAHAVLTRAIELDDGNPQLRVARGEALARGGEYWEAIDDFSAAIDRSPDLVDALTFRAAAYRLLEVYDLAHDDAKRALVIDPDQPDALVELGAILIAQRDPDGARQAWLAAIRAAPSSPAADAARAALERLDVKAE